MRKIALALAMLGTTLVPALYTTFAHAQAMRTWVSSFGDDANPCSRTSPCKTFAGAISKTAIGGEINCVDSDGFGAVTITKSISIMCDGISNGSVLVSGINGIAVRAGPSDKVLLSGLDIEGLGTGVNGIDFSSGLELIIHDCWIHDFATNGVNVNTTTANARIIIQNSRILNNGTNGSANTGGVNVNQNGGASFTLIQNTLIENNQNYALQATGDSTTVAVMNSVLIPTGLVIANGAQVASYGPSNIYGTATNPTSTPAFR